MREFMDDVIIPTVAIAVWCAGAVFALTVPVAAPADAPLDPAQTKAFIANAWFMGSSR